MSHLKPVLDQASLFISLRYPPFNSSTVKLMKFLLTFKYSRNQIIRFVIFLVVVILFIKYCLSRIFT